MAAPEQRKPGVFELKGATAPNNPALSNAPVVQEPPLRLVTPSQLTTPERLPGRVATRTIEQEERLGLTQRLIGTLREVMKKPAAKAVGILAGGVIGVTAWGVSTTDRNIQTEPSTDNAPDATGEPQPVSPAPIPKVENPITPRTTLVYPTPSDGDLDDLEILNRRWEQASTPTPPPKEPQQPETRQEVVKWPIKEVERAVSEGFKQGKTLFPDMWTENGGKAEEAIDATEKTTMLVVNYPKEDLRKIIERKEGFKSPFKGKVEAVGVMPFSKKTSISVIEVKLENGDLGIIFTHKSNPLQVKNGDLVNYGDPLFTHAAEDLVPPFTKDPSKGKQANVVIAIDKPGGKTTNVTVKDNVLSTNDGQRITISHESTAASKK